MIDHAPCFEDTFPLALCAWAKVVNAKNATRNWIARWQETGSEFIIMSESRQVVVAVLALLAGKKKRMQVNISAWLCADQACEYGRDWAESRYLRW